MCSQVLLLRPFKLGYYNRYSEIIMQFNAKHEYGTLWYPNVIYTISGLISQLAFEVLDPIGADSLARNPHRLLDLQPPTSQW